MAKAVLENMPRYSLASTAVLPSSPAHLHASTRQISRYDAGYIPTTLHPDPLPYCALQKQGILPLWFADKADYPKIGAGDVLETVGLADVFNGKPGASVTIKVTKLDGSKFNIATKHTMSVDQLKWLKAGSALNYIRSVKTQN